MKYFGTDGIRGVPNEKLTIDLVTKLGMALEVLDSKDVVLATDTRLSKDMLAQAITCGALSHGLNVHYIGVVPTPCLIYYAYKHNMTGVMITASHNPYYDNGIKVLNKGTKMLEEKEAKVEALIDNPSVYKGEIGRLIENKDAVKEYTDFIKSKVIKTDLKICLDAANGATYKTCKEIFSSITDNLKVICNTPNGTNINNNCGSTHLNALKEEMSKGIYDIGFAFDGDGDRVLCVDSDGTTIDGDMIIYIIARYLKEKNLLSDNKVVLTIMSNLGLIASLRRNGIEVIETNVGDKYVVSALFNNHLAIGGENSGHIIMPNVFHTGDGVFIASQLVKVLEETKCSIKELLSDVTMYGDKMVNIKVNDKSKVLSSTKLTSRIEEIKKELNNDCKIIVRASGTEDLIRVSVMAKSNELVNKYSDELVSIVKSI